MMCHLYLLNVAPSQIKLIEINQQHSEENKSQEKSFREMMDSCTHRLHLMLENKILIYIYMKQSKTMKSREDGAFLVSFNMIQREERINCARIGLILSMQFLQGANCNIYPSTCIKINIQGKKIGISLCHHLVNISPGQQNSLPSFPNFCWDMQFELGFSFPFLSHFSFPSSYMVEICH